MASYFYRLPFPPSTNTYLRHAKNRTYLSAKAKSFRAEVCDCVAVQLRLKERLAVHIEIIAPTRRKFDIDNRIKSTLDALMHAGVFIDDEQIDKLIVERKHVESPGAADVTVVELLNGVNG